MSLNQDDTQTKENRGYIGKQLRQMISKTSHYIDENSSSFNFKHKREKKKKKSSPPRYIHYYSFFGHQEKWKERTIAPNFRGNANTLLHIWSNNGDVVCHYK